MNAIIRSISNIKALNSHIMYGLLLAIGAALGFSVKAIFIKLAYNYEADAITLLMFRMAFALPFFVVIAIAEERKASVPLGARNTLVICMLGMIGYYFSSLLDFIGLQYVSAGLERLILFIYPTFVVIISSIFFNKKIGKEATIALFLCYIGIAFAVFHDLHFTGEHVLFGCLLILGATLTYSLFLVGSGEIIPKVGAKRFTAYAMIVSCVAVIIQFALMRDASYLDQPLTVYGYGFMLAVVSTVIPAFLLAEAIHRIGASSTSIIGALGPVATIIMAALILNEPVSVMQIIGALFVVGGVITLGMKRH
ncbi:EamA domain-containing membrane protein RarD [Mariprofundus ferrinatatus]|uniref:EamA domain-containing membrane protein RarD n=1 Tax=Mariprofundus ferrinatatus TaxID=1921087 RepID=A0A2K8LAR9_9PROT|nr:DMT family transporter [Mariprofundus ferrinatatus]ATX82991.1 EamA domain-containing membrane protein RarD [Mariprofundus ferrinatatus]